MPEMPVTESHADALIERLRTRSLSYQAKPDNRDLMADLYDARNAVVRAKNKLQDYYWTCPESEIKLVRRLLADLEIALDTIVA